MVYMIFLNIILIRELYMIRGCGHVLRAPTLLDAGIISTGRHLGLLGGLKIGVWRSLVARTAGGREVAGSSPVTPTMQLFTATL